MWSVGLALCARCPLTTPSGLVLLSSSGVASRGGFGFPTLGREAAVAVHLASVLHASRSPPLPLRRPSAHLLMQSSISGELYVGPEGREVGHSCYANARRDRGRYGPSGGRGTHTGPLSSRDQHAAAVRGNRAAHVCLCLQEWLLIGISTMER